MDTKFALNAAKLFILAAISAIIVGLIATLDTGSLPTLDQAKTMGITAITAGISYVVFKLFLNNNTVGGLEMVNSKLFDLNWHDVLKSTILVVVAAILKALPEILKAGTFPTIADLKKAALTGLVVGLSYMLKNFFSNSETQLAKKEIAVPNA